MSKKFSKYVDDESCMRLKVEDILEAKNIPYRIIELEG